MMAAELSEEQIKALNEAFPGWEPVSNEEGSVVDFDKPIKGKYNVRIDELKRIQGKSDKTGDEYDFVVLKLQVIGIHSGDRANNRYLDKSYGMIDSSFTYNGKLVEISAEAEGQKMLNDLFTAGIFNDFIPSTPGIEGLLEESSRLTDKVLTISAWGTKSGKQKIKVLPFAECEEVESEEGWS